MASDSELRTSTGKKASTSSDFRLCSFPNKHPKNVTLTHPPFPTSTEKGKGKGKGKGKEKIDDEISDEGEGAAMDSDQKKICGICLSEEGKAIRGWIDSCDHYFCFVCIMEWSKIESLCPMCKQRFNTIRRPQKDRVFIRQRIVNIPVRDQVYHPFGNATTGPSDPYAEVRCSECNGNGDESFLLLCDLCDSAAHTYCVGLGLKVPEGDWYCHDCAISRDEHSNSEVENDYGNKKFSINFDVTPNQAPFPIFDIVREPNIPEVDRTLERTFADPNQLPSPIIPQRNSSAGSKVRDPCARTLHRCRNVHSRIQGLRENWNSLRRGSLDFSSGLLDSRGKSSMEGYSRAICPDRSSHLHSSSFMSCQQMPSKDTVSGDMLHNKNPYDIDRAWKMLNIAKSEQQARQGSSINHPASNRPSANGHTTKEAVNVNSGSLVSRNKDLRTALEKNNKCHSLDMAQENHRPQKSAKQRSSRDMMEETSKFDTGYPTTHLSRYFQTPSARQLQKLKVDVSQKSKGQKSLKVSPGASSNLTKVRDGSAYSENLVDSLPGCFDTFHSKAEICASFGCHLEPPKANGGLEKNPSLTDIMGREDADAKNEVQSLVKLNLKLLTGDKHLGVDGFKVIARQATHTILAACGLKHIKSIARPFPNPTCSHASNSQQIHVSKLMSSSCRECFYVFVKDVVNSIMAEKIAGVGTC